MIEISFVLLLHLSGKIEEYTYQESLSECLGTKRRIERNMGNDYTGTARWSCNKYKVKIGMGPTGNPYVVKLIEAN